MREEKPDRVVNGRIQAIVLPTRERCDKRVEGDHDIIIIESPRGGVQQKSFAFPLDYYLRKDLITGKQWWAGTKLNDLWARGCLAGYSQVKYHESNDGERSMEFAPPGAFAIEYREAMMAIRGLKERKVAYDVCCDGIFLRKSKRFRNQWAALRYGMDHLKSALDDLSEHFKDTRDPSPKRPFMDH